VNRIGQREAVAIAAILAASLVMKFILMDHIAGRSYHDVMRSVSFGLGIQDGTISIRTHVDNTKSFLGPMLNVALFNAGGLAAIKGFNALLFSALFAVMAATGRALYSPRIVIVAAGILAFYAGGHRNVVAGEIEDTLASLLFAAGFYFHLRHGRTFVAALLMGLAFLVKFWIAIFIGAFGVALLIQRAVRHAVVVTAGVLVPVVLISFADGGATVQSLFMTVTRQSGYSTWPVIAARMLTTGLLPVLLAAGWVLAKRPIRHAMLFFLPTATYFTYILLFRDAFAVTFVMMLCLTSAGFLVASFLADSLVLRRVRSPHLALGALMVVYAAGNFAVAWQHLYRDTRPFSVAPGRDAQRLRSRPSNDASGDLRGSSVVGMMPDEVLHRVYPGRDGDR
jgi:hypothetical protein